MSEPTRIAPASERPEGLQDFAIKSLIRAIISGDLGPGAKLSPTKIAADLRISHIPVREALAHLEAAGHVMRVPRVGFFVTHLSLEYIEDVYHWRQVLEDEAHRIAVPILTDDDFARMRRFNKMADDSQAYGPNYLDFNRELHFIAFEKVGSESLLRFLNHLWDASLRYQNALSSSTGTSRAMLAEQHNGLIDAFEQRDADLVNQRMAEHRGVTLRLIRDLLPAVEQSQPDTPVGEGSLAAR